MHYLLQGYAQIIIPELNRMVKEKNENISLAGLEIG